MNRAKRFLRDSKTGRFFKDGLWTENREEARVFASITEASDAAKHCDADQLEVVIHFADGVRDMVIPVRTGN